MCLNFKKDSQSGTYEQVYAHAIKYFLVLAVCGAEVDDKFESNFAYLTVSKLL